MFNPTVKNKERTLGAPEYSGAHAALKLAGLASLLFYILFSLLAFLVPGADRSFFPPYIALPVTIDDTSGLVAIGTMIIACAIALFVIYFYALRQAGRLEAAPASGTSGAGIDTARLVFAFTILFHLLMIAFPTLLSTDLFDYVRHGRIFAVYGENPLTVPAIFFQQDPFFNLGGWVSTGSVYGPLHAYISGGLALISGDSVGSAFMIFKSFYIGVNIINVWLIWKIAARLIPGDEARALVFFGWNPFIIIMVAANGHNDILMLAFVLAAVLLYLEKRPMAGVLCLTLATLVKFITLPLLVLYIAMAIRRQQGATRRIATGLWSTAIVLGTTVISYIPFWEGWGTFDYLTGVGNKTGFTIASLLNGFVRGMLGMPRMTTVILLTVPLVIYSAWKLARVRELSEYIHIAAVISIFLPLVMFWFQPWYLVLAMGLVALRPRGILYVTMIVFSVSVLFFDNFWWQSPIRMDIQKLLRVLVVFGPPLIVFAYMQLRASGGSAWRRFTAWSLETVPGNAGVGTGVADAAPLTPVRMALELGVLLFAAAVPLAVTISASEQLSSFFDLLLVKLRLLLPF